MTCCYLVTETQHIKMFVLDEADEMLSRGFKDQIYDVFRQLNENIQVSLILLIISSHRCVYLCPTSIVVWIDHSCQLIKLFTVVSNFYGSFKATFITLFDDSHFV